MPTACLCPPTSLPPPAPPPAALLQVRAALSPWELTGQQEGAHGEPSAPTQRQGRVLSGTALRQPALSSPAEPAAGQCWSFSPRGARSCPVTRASGFPAPWLSHPRAVGGQPSCPSLGESPHLPWVFSEGGNAPCPWICCCSITQLCLTLCNPMDYSAPGLPVPSLTPGVYSNSCPLSW